MYLLCVKSNIHYSQIPSCVGHILPMVFAEEGKSICGIFKIKALAEYNLTMLQDAIKSIKIENKLLMDYITYYIEEVNFDMSNINENTHLAFIMKNGFKLCHLELYNKSKDEKYYKSLSKIFVDNGEKDFIFDVFSMEIDIYYSATTQGLKPLYEFETIDY